LSPEVLEKLREAGRIAAAVRSRGATAIVAGARLRDVCEGVEDEIRQRGGGVAFPVQSSRNHVAAHYCPSPEDETVYADGDLAKLDIGVHIDGWVVDTALTVNVGDHPLQRPLVEAARAALEAAIDAVRPGIEIRRISAAIESTIAGFGLRPMRSLCGHGVGRFLVHCPPAIPNVLDDGRGILQRGAVVAIEPFATDGLGLLAEEGTPEVFRFAPRAGTTLEDLEASETGAVIAAMQGFQGLPFARRQLSAFTRPQVEQALDTLRRRGALMVYPPLLEAGGRPVAQAEHTIVVGDGGAEVLTR
jgi:methionyl aminopeptidase